MITHLLIRFNIISNKFFIFYLLYKEFRSLSWVEKQKLLLVCVYGKGKEREKEKEKERRGKGEGEGRGKERGKKTK